MNNVLYIETNKGIKPLKIKKKSKIPYKKIGNKTVSILKKIGSGLGETYNQAQKYETPIMNWNDSLNDFWSTKEKNTRRRRR